MAVIKRSENITLEWIHEHQTSYFYNIKAGLQFTTTVHFQILFVLMV